MEILMMPLFERLLYAVGGANEGKPSNINVESGCDKEGEEGRDVDFIIAQN